VPVERIEAALREAVGRVDVSQASAVGLITMAPAWLAMDERGGPITPLVTHQDRRSLKQARRIEAEVGRERHLALAGNRPTPGGISSTTAAWFVQNTEVIDRAAILGHLPTYLIHRLTGEWTIDPSNAGFSGLMDVATLDWSAQLCAAAGVRREKLPPIVELGACSSGDLAAAPSRASSGDAGQRRVAAATSARRLGLRSGENDLGIPAGLPLIGGLVDGSGAMLLAGAKPGQIVHSVGSTDVVALCLDRPMPREGLLCRPLGYDGLWLSAATLAAGGSALSWARDVLFAGASEEERNDLLRAAAAGDAGGVRFDPHLAGDRQSVDQPMGAFTGLTLATTREQMLAAVVEALVESSGERIGRLLSLADEAGVAVERRVVVTGRLGEVLDEAIHSRWPGSWTFDQQESATVRGLGRLWP
jgi:xylulokinase